MADTGQGNAIIEQHVSGAHQLVKNSASHKPETRDWGLNLGIAIKEEEAISERVLFALWLLSLALKDGGVFIAVFAQA